MAAQDDGGQIVEKGTRCRRTCESHFRNCVINLEESTGAPSITMAGACCIRSWFIFTVLVIIAVWWRLALGLYWFRGTRCVGSRLPLSLNSWTVNVAIVCLCHHGAANMRSRRSFGACS